MSPKTHQRVALAGLGAIGKVLASALAHGEVPGMSLSAVSAKDQAKARALMKSLECNAPVIPIKELHRHADIVVECAPPELLSEIAVPVLEAGKKLVVLSIGALLTNMDLLEIAESNGGAICVPTGALIGLDAVNAAAVGSIHQVRMITRKPPIGLKGAPHLVEHQIDIDDLIEPLMVFSGTARDAAKGFPANLNVAVALSLAGLGPDRTLLEIWADPTVTRNTHRIEVDSDSARFSMTIENIPSENPRTGLITSRSVIALLRKMNASLRVGT